MPERVRRNILKSEAACPCGCGLIASDEFLDEVQALIDRLGFPVPISQMTRCPAYNLKIGGSTTSAHLLSAMPGPFGAIDHKIKSRSRKHGGKPDRAYRLRRESMALGWNNFEVCDEHGHAGKVPLGHPQHEAEYWGRSL